MLPNDSFKIGQANLGAHCREISGTAIQALLRLVDEIAIDGKVSTRDIHKIAKVILAAEGPVAAAYVRREQKCTFAFHRAVIECQRADILGRLVVFPLEEWLDQPQGLERKRIAQFLLAVRMMVGEEDHESLRQKAAQLADAHRGSDGFVDWDTFYADPAGTLIIEHVQVALAKSFKRFEPRCDWFLVVMNANPSSVSLSSNAFVQIKPEDRAQFGFTEIHMANVFDALFASVRTEAFTSDRLRVFARRWALSPEKMFGPLFLEIARLRCAVR